MPGLELFKSGFRSLRENSDTAIYWGMWYFFIVLLYGIVTGWMNRIDMSFAFTDAGGGGAMMGLTMIVTLLAVIAYFVLNAGFSVGWLRQVTGVETFKVTLGNLFRREAWSYLGYSILLALIVMGVMMIIAGIFYLLGVMIWNSGSGEPNAFVAVLMGIIGILIGLFMYALMIRLTPALVSRALSGHLGFGEALRATKGRTGEIIGFIFLWFLALIPVMLLCAGVSYIFMGGMHISFMGIILNAVFNAIIATIFMLAMLGQMAYLFQSSVEETVDTSADASA